MPESRLGVPADQAERDAISSALDRTLFVSAGAGSGKTSTLVDRLVALVVSGTMELDCIAAVTFTEKAAAELRDRVRTRLENVVETDDSVTGERCRRALDQLDRAPIGTLHSFAQRILSEHPVEAGLPPRIEVLDEVSSGIEFEERWRTFHDSMLDDPSMARPLLLLLAGGVREGVARSLALAFEDNWDLVATHVPALAPDPPALRPAVDSALELADRMLELRRQCTAAGDLLLERVDEIALYVAELRSASSEVELLEKLGPGPHSPSFRAGNIGRAASWGTRAGDVRDVIRQLGDALAGARAAVLEACAHQLGAAVRRFTLSSAQSRQVEGRLDFHDLLVLARRLVSDPVHGPSVRATLSKRYRCLLLDEFQDTDPIQVELAVRIAADAPWSLDPDAAWQGVAVGPGRLFMVGDPKQSIYRFRRADIGTFLAAEELFGEGRMSLTTNFRAVAPIIAWVNHAFDQLFQMPVETLTPLPSQPSFEPLSAWRQGSPPAGPAVSVIGRDPYAPDLVADDLRVVEAGEVARAIRHVVEAEWAVDDGDGGWRPARLGDITVLVPARTSLPFLEDALDDLGIPFRAEANSLVYASRAVRDLLMVLRAIDDPTDELRIVGALRTPLLACGDDDLWRYRMARQGRWDYLQDRGSGPPELGDNPVDAALSFLREMHRLRTWLSPAELLDRVARDRRVFELAHPAGRERDVWRRMRYVIDQARAWSDAVNGTLRQYLRWVDLQAAESARLSEPILPESDHDAVRIMTIHAAKGLEFPVTILSGMSTEPRRRPAPVEVVFLHPGPGTGMRAATDLRVGYRFGAQTATPEFVDNVPIDEQMALDERIRLLYVAATRARDHLIVSLCRKTRAANRIQAAASKTNAELVVAGMGDLLEAISDTVDGSYEPVDGREAAAADEVGEALDPQSGGQLTPRGQWEAERAATLLAASTPTTVAATALTDEGQPDPGAEPVAPDPGLQKQPQDMDRPPWLKGRYGTSVGRAVHAVLQTIDLATGEGRREAVAAQCEAEAVPDQRRQVESLVDHALASAVVQEAAQSPHWREVYAGVPAPGGRLLEGYIDLLYQSPQGLVVVDYKTSSTSDPEELDRRVERYRYQGAAYAWAVGQATRSNVSRVVFLFLTPEGPVERALPEVGASVAELELRIAAGTEVVVA